MNDAVDAVENWRHSVDSVVQMRGRHELLLLPASCIAKATT